MVLFINGLKALAIFLLIESTMLNGSMEPLRALVRL